MTLFRDKAHYLLGYLTGVNAPNTTRCLICDMDIAGQAAPSVYGEYFQQYVRYMHCLKRLVDTVMATVADRRLRMESPDK